MKFKMMVEVNEETLEEERWRLAMVLREVCHTITDEQIGSLVGTKPIMRDGKEIGAFRVYEETN